MIQRIAGLLALVLASAVATMPAIADYASALKAYQDKHYEAAFAQFRELAELGHVGSQRNLGVLYLRGEGTFRNGAQGYAWIRLAADAGDAQAIAVEASVHDLYAEDAAQIVAETRSRFGPEALREQLLPKILPNCEYASRDAPVFDKGSIKGLQFPREASSQGREGWIVVSFQVAPDGKARSYRFVTGVFQDLWRDAMQYVLVSGRWKPAIRDGVPVASEAHILFRFMYSERGDLDYRRADRFVQQIKSAAESGDAPSQYLYGLLLSSHPQYHKPWSEALPWIEKAAAAGVREAQYQLGYSLISGHGCEPDAAKGLVWLEKAAQGDLPDAQVTLARLMLERRALEGAAKPVFWMKRASERNDFDAQLDLAALYAADPDPAVRDAPRALALSKALMERDSDNPIVLEVHAAALAAAERYRDAAGAEERAIAMAKRRGWDLTPMQQRLEAYRASRAWTGPLLPELTH